MDGCLHGRSKFARNHDGTARRRSKAAIETAKAFTAEGKPVRYNPEHVCAFESRCMCLFEAGNPEAVKELNDRAKIPYTRSWKQPISRPEHDETMIDGGCGETSRIGDAARDQYSHCRCSSVGLRLRRVSQKGLVSERRERRQHSCPRVTSCRRHAEARGRETGDVVYDLGSGDGRIVILAAQKYGRARRRRRARSPLPRSRARSLVR